jgi:hypothetical protein
MLGKIENPVSGVLSYLTRKADTLVMFKEILELN